MQNLFWNCRREKKKLFKDFFLLIFFTFEVPFKRPFAPTFLSQMSKIFRDLEFFGKSNGQKWSQIWTFLLKNGLESPRHQKFFLRIFFFICSLHLNIFLPPLPKVQCPNLINFLNSLGKLMERSGLRFDYFCSKRV